jgi:hypothetical protein
MNRHRIVTKGKNKRYNGWDRWVDRNEDFLHRAAVYSFCPDCRIKTTNTCNLCGKPAITIGSIWKLPRKQASNKIWNKFYLLLRTHGYLI